MIERKKFISFLQKRRIEVQSRYLQEGRAYAGLTADQLRSEWVTSFRQMAVDPANPDVRFQNEQLEAEFDTRDLTPPYELLGEDFDKFVANTDSLKEELKKNDPAEWLRIREEMAEELEDYEDNARKKSN